MYINTKHTQSNAVFYPGAQKVPFRCNTITVTWWQKHLCDAFTSNINYYGIQ